MVSFLLKLISQSQPRSLRSSICKPVYSCSTMKLLFVVWSVTSALSNFRATFIHCPLGKTAVTLVLNTIKWKHWRKSTYGQVNIWTILCLETSSVNKGLIIPIRSSDQKLSVDWDPGFVFIETHQLVPTKKTCNLQSTPDTYVLRWSYRLWWSRDIE